MVSSSPQDEKQKYLKYKLKEPVIRFTYHSSHVPFVWRGIRPVVLSERCKNELTLALLHLCCKEIRHLCQWRVHEKSFIARKIATSDMKRVVFSSLWIAFRGNMLLLSNSAAPKTARSRNALTKSAKGKNFLYFLAHAQTKVPLLSLISSLVRIWKIRHSSPGCSFVWILRVVYFPVKHSCL